jgi:hypothetical protein
VLNGVNDDGSIIKEFEASHGTVTDMWKVRSSHPTATNLSHGTQQHALSSATCSVFDATCRSLHR